MKKDEVKEEYSGASNLTVKLLSKSLRVIPSGSVKIDINSLPAAAIFVEQQGKKLSIDLIEPDLLLRLQNDIAYFYIKDILNIDQLR